MVACRARLHRSHASAIGQAVLGAAFNTPGCLQDYRALCHGERGATEHRDPGQAGEQLPRERAPNRAPAGARAGALLNAANLVVEP